MAMKRRPPVDQSRIEAFGAAADAPTEAVTAKPAVAKPVRAAARTTVGEWPAGVPRSILIRLTTPAIALELAEVAALDDCSQQKTAQRALEMGLQALRRELSS